MLLYFVEESENIVLGKWEVPYFVEEFEDIVGGKWEVRLYFARPRNSSLEAWEFFQSKINKCFKVSGRMLTESYLVLVHYVHF